MPAQPLKRWESPPRQLPGSPEAPGTAAALNSGETGLGGGAGGAPPRPPCSRSSRGRRCLIRVSGPAAPGLPLRSLSSGRPPRTQLGPSGAEPRRLVFRSSGSERDSPAGSAAGCRAPRGRAHRVRGGPGAGYKSCPRGSPSQLRGCPGTCPGSRVSRPGDGDISLDEKTRRPVLRPKHHAQLLRQLEDHPIGKLRGFAQSAGGERDAEEDRRGGGIQAGGGDQAGGRHFLHQNLHHGAHHGDQLQDRRGVRGADGGRETLQEPGEMGE